MIGTNQTLTEEEINTLIKEAHIGSMASRNYMHVNPAIPDHDSPPDQDRLSKWVSMHEGEYQIVAQKIADNLHHVSFDEFYQALISCAHRLNQDYAQKGIKGEDVVIAVPFIGSPKSNPWVMSLLLRHLEFKPAKIIEGLDNRAVREYLSQNKNIKKILVADDASYSGVDLSLMLDSLQDCARRVQSNATIDLVVPFITNKATQTLSEFCQIWSEQIMPTINELPLTEGEKNLLNSHNISGYPNARIEIDRLTLTYFSHKMADSYSVPEKLLRFGFLIPARFNNQDYNLIMSGIKAKPANFEQQMCRFIPEIAPCYKLENPPLRLSDRAIKTTLRK